MYMQQFIQAFAGDESLALCRAMAIANGNQSLDHQTLTQDEAKRHIISYTQVPSFHQWEELSEEIFEALSGKTNEEASHYIHKIHMKLRHVAAYFHSTGKTENHTLINAYFSCIKATLTKARQVLEAVGYCDSIDLSIYNHKWNKPSFHAIAGIGLALERLGNIIQGCLYESHSAKTIFDYEKENGVLLVKDITTESLAKAMDWTLELAESHMHIQPGQKRKIVPLSTIEELAAAITDGKITKDGALQCSNREFVQYCYDHRYFLPLNKADWKPIDSLLKARNGKVLTADILSKVAHQLDKEGYIEKATRYSKR